MEAINKQILTNIYYLDKLSMILKNSLGVVERINTLSNLLIKLDNVYEELLMSRDIFNDNYTDNITQDTNTNKYLDMIGNIFGLSRNFTINAGSINKPTSYNDIETNYFKYVNLNDYEFLVYIKLQIIKQNFTGTREELATLYNLDSNQKSISPLNFIYITQEGNSHGEVKIYWQDTEGYSTDFMYMFLNGYLSIESMGIIYDRVIGNVKSIAVFRDINNKPTDAYGDFDDITKNNALPEEYRKVFG